MDFHIRLTEATNHCGNFFSMDEQMKMLIEGLDPTFKTIASRYRQYHPEVSFLHLFNYAEAQGAAARARDKGAEKVFIQEPIPSIRTKTPPLDWGPRNANFNLFYSFFGS